MSEFFDSGRFEWFNLHNLIKDAKRSKAFSSVAAMLANAVLENDISTVNELRTALLVISDVILDASDASQFLDGIRSPKRPKVDICSRVKLRKNVAVGASANSSCTTLGKPSTSQVVGGITRDFFKIPTNVAQNPRFLTENFRKNAEDVGNIVHDCQVGSNMPSTSANVENRTEQCPVSFDYHSLPEEGEVPLDESDIEVDENIRKSSEFVRNSIQVDRVLEQIAAPPPISPLQHRIRPLPALPQIISPLTPSLLSRIRNPAQTTTTNTVQSTQSLTADKTLPTQPAPQPSSKPVQPRTAKALFCAPKKTMTRFCLTEEDSDDENLLLEALRSRASNEGTKADDEVREDQSKVGGVENDQQRRLENKDQVEKSRDSVLTRRVEEKTSENDGKQSVNKVVAVKMTEEIEGVEKRTTVRGERRRRHRDHDKREVPQKKRNVGNVCEDRGTGKSAKSIGNVIQPSSREPRAEPTEKRKRRPLSESETEQRKALLSFKIPKKSQRSDGERSEIHRAKGDSDIEEGQVLSPSPKKRNRRDESIQSHRRRNCTEGKSCRRHFDGNRRPHSESRRSTQSSLNSNSSRHNNSQPTASRRPQTEWKHHEERMRLHDNRRQEHVVHEESEVRERPEEKERAKKSKERQKSVGCERDGVEVVYHTDSTVEDLIEDYSNDKNAKRRIAPQSINNKKRTEHVKNKVGASEPNAESVKSQRKCSSRPRDENHSESTTSSIENSPAQWTNRPSSTQSEGPASSSKRTNSSMSAKSTHSTDGFFVPLDDIEAVLSAAHHG